jgi:hypothetical protein
VSIRLIIKNTNRDQGHVRVELETYVIDHAGLESILRRGGFGGGPNGDDFLYSEVIGAEVVKEELRAAIEGKGPL